MISFKYVLAAIFPETFTLDEEYNELFANKKLDILSYPYPIRKMFYDYYSPSMDENKQLTKEDIERIMNEDKDLLYVKNPTNIVVWYDERTKQIVYVPYKRLIEQDYKYMNAKQNKRNHTNMSIIVYYVEDKEYNINLYLQRNIYPVCDKFDKTLMSHVITYDNLLRYYNEIGKDDLNTQIIIKRFLTTENDLFDFIDKLGSTDLKTKYCIQWIKDKQYFMLFDFNKWSKLNIFDSKIYGELICFYDCFPRVIYNRIKNNNDETYDTILKILSYINDKNEKTINVNINKWFKIAFSFIYIKKQYSLIGNACKNWSKQINYNEVLFDKYVNCCESERYTNKTQLVLQVDFINLFEPKYVYKSVHERLNKIDKTIYDLKCLPTIINSYDIYEYVKDMDEYLNYIDKIKDQLDDYAREVVGSLVEILTRKDKDVETIKNYIMRYNDLVDYKEYKYKDHTLAYYWVKYIRDEPFYDIYVSPLVENLGSLWKSMFSVPPPREMTDIKFYKYMMKNHGNRRPQNITAFYSYFSNSNENKFIFINNDNTLEHEARLRYIIPIDYEKVKEFLTEELETNDICLFTKLSDKDWQKIAGGNDRIDCVVFSDWADVFRRRTTPSKLIKYLKEAIETKFEVELKEENDLDDN